MATSSDFFNREVITKRPKRDSPVKFLVHGDTKLKWSGKYEAHLWDNRIPVDGRKRKDIHDKELKQQPLQRLIGLKENKKFQSEDDPSAGIRTIIRATKEKNGLKYVYVWHAITGYWGGVRPGVEGMEKFGSRMKYPKVSAGVMENESWMKTDPLTVQGLGLVDPKSVHRFYRDLHGYLASAGVDGVKVDVQCVLEALGAGLGGRVELTRMYHQALDEWRSLHLGGA